MGSTISLRSDVAKANRLKTVQALINGGLDLDDNYFMCRLNFRRHVGKSKLEDLFDKKLWPVDACEMLHVAAVDGDLGLVNMLIESGVPLNTTTKIEGYTVTHTAAISRDIGVLKAVVAARAPVNEKDREEASPLAAASSINFPEGVDFLMESDAVLATEDVRVTPPSSWPRTPTMTPRRTSSSRPASPPTSTTPTTASPCCTWPQPSSRRRRHTR